MISQFRQRALERHRKLALSRIREERLVFELMLQRVNVAGYTPNQDFVNNVFERIAQTEERAKLETSFDKLDELIVAAERQGELRAYVCPPAEIRDEGNLVVDRMKEWNVPQGVIDTLRDTLNKKVEDVQGEPTTSQNALRSVFAEYDSWARYTEQYEEAMTRYAWWLCALTFLSIPLAIFAFQFSMTFLIGLLLAGLAGSCVSVMARMPMLEVTLSGELAAYQRRILSRIGVGVVATLAGCALLAWGLPSVAIQGETFADVLAACSNAKNVPCGSLKTLILLGIPMLFGFSERALTSLGQQVIGRFRGEPRR